MCGIAGKVDPMVDRQLIRAMCAELRHRGPDSQGVFLEEGIGMGVQRLAVIDVQTGDQPIANEDESVVVVLNGEIYNYVELRADLQARGHRFRTNADTEVIVHLYEERGDACVDALRGMFAFALWDRPRRRLLIARDRLGKKPLYYRHHGRSLWFASEPKAILRDPAVPRRPDLGAIDRFLHYGYVAGVRSAFADLKRLPPAHTLVLEDGALAVQRYWKLSYRTAGEATTEAEAHERIREGLLEATRIRLRSDVPLGAFLSGGVDSGAVVAAMARSGARDIETFSVAFDDPRFDESAHAREVSQRYGTIHNELRFTADPVDLVTELPGHFGEPFGDPSAIPTLFLARETRRRVTVALSGDGGDENFAGYRRYDAARLASLVDRVPPVLLGVAHRALAALPGSLARAAWHSRTRRLVRGARNDPADRYAEWVAHFSPSERRRLYTDDYGVALEQSEWQRPVQGPWESSDAESLVERLLDVDLNLYLPDDLLVKADIASMSHSLEVRSPLLDHEFMEMAAALPSSAKLRGRTSKAIFKAALKPWLPKSVLYRPKQGFEVPLETWFGRELRDLPADVLLDSRTLDRGLFRRSAIEGLLAETASGGHGGARKLWTLLQLELWFRTWIDRRDAPAPVPAMVA